MPTPSTLRRPRSMRSSPGRNLTRRVHIPTIGQCFEIEVTPEADGWVIRIPEIGGIAHARRRTAVELAARECIAARTGMPIGYIAVFVKQEG